MGRNISKQKAKDIYSLVGDYPKEKIKEVIESLDDNDKRLLELRYGKDLDNPVFYELSDDDRVRFHSHLVFKIRRLLEGGFGKRIKSFYEHFSDYTEETVNEALTRIPLKDQELLKKVYGEDLKSICFDRCSKDEKQRAFNIIPKIRIRIKKPDLMEQTRSFSIYQYYSDYTKEEIDSSIESLTDEERRIIIMRYGLDLANPVFEKMPKKEMQIFYDQILPKIGKLLENPNYISGRKYRTIYDHFPDFTREEVDNCLFKLNDFELELIRYRYGEDLNNPSYKVFNRKQNKYFFERLIPKIGRLLANPDYIGRVPLIYGYFPDYTREEVNIAISKLRDEHKDLIRHRYGEDLENPVISKFDHNQNVAFYGPIFKAIRNLLKDPNFKVWQQQTIYDFFDGYSKEDVDLVINYLEDEHKELLKYKYGEDLSNPEFKSLDKRQTEILYNCIIPRIRKGLNNLKGNGFKKFNDYFPGYSVEDINKALLSLSLRDQEIIKHRYGEDFSNIFLGPCERKDVNRIYTTIVPKISSFLSQHISAQTNNLVLDKGICLEVLEFLQTPSFKLMTEDLSIEEAIVIALRYGYVDNKYFSHSAIAKFLDISIDRVLDDDKKALLLFQEKMNLYLDKVIDTVSGSRKRIDKNND